MTEYNLDSTFPSDEMVIRRIVRAIQKAIEEDMPEFCRENHMETMNSVRYIRGDKINDNLKLLVVSENVRLISFKRYSWDGRILVDEKNHITYNVTTQQNLAAIPKKKNRSSPHFLHSVLAVENGDLKGQYVQETFFPVEQFEDTVLEEDYIKIVSSVLSPDSGYRHYVIAYKFEKNELLDIKMVLLDKSFNIVRELSLNDYIKPDFGQLTIEQPKLTDYTADPAKNARDLVAIKSGVRPDLLDFEDEKQV